MQGNLSWGSRYMQGIGDPGMNSLTLNLGQSSSLPGSPATTLDNLPPFKAYLLQAALQHTLFSPFLNLHAFTRC